MDKILSTVEPLNLNRANICPSLAEMGSEKLYFKILNWRMFMNFFFEIKGEFYGLELLVDFFGIFKIDEENELYVAHRKVR